MDLRYLSFLHKNLMMIENFQKISNKENEESIVKYSDITMQLTNIVYWNIQNNIYKTAILEMLSVSQLNK